MSPITLAPPRTPVGQVVNTTPGVYTFLGETQTTSGNLGANVRAMPLWVPEPAVIDRIGLEVTAAGDAGSLVRLGLWKDAGNGALPAAVQLDAGTLPGDVVQIGELVVPRIPNLLTPSQASMEADIVGLLAGTNTTIARSTAFGADGLASLALTSVGAGNMAATTFNARYPAAPGDIFTAVASFRADAVVRNVNVELFFYDSLSGGAQTGSIVGTQVADTTTGWTQAQVTSNSGSAPAGTQSVGVVMRVVGAAGAGEIHYVDKVGLFRSPALPATTWALQGAGVLDVGTYWIGSQPQNYTVTQPSFRVASNRMGVPVAPTAAAGVVGSAVGATVAQAPGPLLDWLGGQSIIGQCARLFVRVV